jgi:ergothioneine biosynthesis protein EgtB
MTTSMLLEPGSGLTQRLLQVRACSEALAGPLETEDFLLQSMPDASPAKWHLAHVTWFFETFVLDGRLEGYRAYDSGYRFLFNSYYHAIGERHPRPERGLLSRPSVEEVFEYRRHVDEALMTLLSREIPEEVASVIETGMHHEQQHQELLLTDLKHAFSRNPLFPAYREDAWPDEREPSGEPVPLGWCPHPGGVVPIGAAGTGERSRSFCFDNELPTHETLLPPFALSSRLVTNGDYLEFIEEGGYRQPEWWLSDGWDVVEQRGWTAPLYWVRTEQGWREFTLAGLRPLRWDAPVTHVSLYEADAYARWRGCRLPTEFEWETLVRSELDLDDQLRPGEEVLRRANFVETEAFHPRPASRESRTIPVQLFGDVWEWTSSPYGPYPGYAPPAGALGEYNGKFMCNQFVLRGGSCVSPASHLRASYRNFFHPDKRWQFTGIRLARQPG